MSSAGPSEGVKQKTKQGGSPKGPTVFTLLTDRNREPVDRGLEGWNLLTEEKGGGQGRKREPG